MENKRNQVKLPKLGTKEFNDTASQYFGGNPKKSTRELALEWWNSLPVDSVNSDRENGTKCGLTNKHLGSFERFNSLTGREIEKIWRKETKEGSDREIIELAFPDLKPNQKQFKEFNPELFKAYISKFSDEDKIKAVKEIIKTLNTAIYVNYIQDNEKSYWEFNTERIIVKHH